MLEIIVHHWGDQLLKNNPDRKKYTGTGGREKADSNNHCNCVLLSNSETSYSSQYYPRKLYKIVVFIYNIS